MTYSTDQIAITAVEFFKLHDDEILIFKVQPGTDSGDVQRLADYMRKTLELAFGEEKAEHMVGRVFIIAGDFEISKAKLADLEQSEHPLYVKY